MSRISLTKLSMRTGQTFRDGSSIYGKVDENEWSKKRDMEGIGCLQRCWDGKHIAHQINLLRTGIRTQKLRSHYFITFARV